MLVQPATVDRWLRDGFSRWWPRRRRRAGRPRVDAECRGLIQQMAAENRLWGAPRIHGELDKPGIAVSERTVSRYLRECPRRSSQTWRTSRTACGRVALWGECLGKFGRANVANAWHWISSGFAIMGTARQPINRENTTSAIRLASSL